MLRELKLGVSPDGTVLKDEMVLVDPSGEPFIGDDIFIDVIGGA